MEKENNKHVVSNDGELPRVITQSLDLINQSIRSRKITNTELLTINKHRVSELGEIVFKS